MNDIARGAIAHAPAERWRLGLLLTGNVLFGAGLYVHAFLFNFYLRELNLPTTVMGHQVAAMTLGGLAALLPAGMLIDRRGARAAMLSGVVLSTCGLAFTALLRTPSAILAAAFTIGLGAACCRVAWGPAIMRLASATDRSRAFTWNVALLTGSGAAFVYLSGRLPGWTARAGFSTLLTGTQVTLLAGAAITLAAALCYAPLRALATVTRATADRPVGQESALPPRGLRWTIAGVAFWMFAAALVLPFFNVYFTDRFAMPMAGVGTVFSLSSVVTALLLVGAAELARRHGALRMFVTWALLLAPALLAMAVPGPLAVAIALYVLQGYIAPATNPLIDQLLLERAPPSRHGAVAGWRNAAAELSGAAGASAGGRILQATSYSVLFVVAAAVAAVSSLLLIGALRRAGNQPPSAPSDSVPPSPLRTSRSAVVST